MKDHHYFVSTALNWSIDEDLFAALDKNRRMHGKKRTGGTVYVAYRVPVPIAQDYQINNYRPVVDGVELLAEGVYE